MKGRKGLDVTVQSCSLWAPACTTDLFHQAYFSAIEERRIRRFLMLTLTEQAEAADNVAGIYGKSLLHLVSSALEDEPRVPDDSEGTPIMGMTKCVMPDRDRAGYPEIHAPHAPEVRHVDDHSSADCSRGRTWPATGRAAPRRLRR